MSFHLVSNRIAHLVSLTFLIIASANNCYAITTDSSLDMSWQDTISVSTAMVIDHDTITKTIGQKEVTTTDLVLDQSHMALPDSIAIDTLSAMAIASKPSLRFRDFAISGAEVVGANLLFHVATRYIANEDYAHISWESIKNNFKKGFYWDNDKFETNLYSHPYQGSLYFNCARSNGLSFWQSAPYAAFGSFIWEFFGETQPPSTNDIFATTLGGMALGEIEHRVSSLMLDETASGSERVIRELAAAVINPIGGVRRLVTGQMWKRGTRYVNAEAAVPFHIQLGLGYRYINDHSTSDKKHVSNIDITFAYDSPFAISGRVPFEAFKVRLSYNLFTSQPHISIINACATIWGRNLELKNGNRLFAGIFQNYNFYNTEALRSDGDAPFRIAETVSYGPGIIFRHTWRNNMILLSGYASGILLGGSKSDHYMFQERDYDMGSGFSLRSENLIMLNRKLAIYTAIDHYRIFTWKGYEKKNYQNIDPNYLNVQGATGNAWMHVIRLRATIPVFKHIGLSAEWAWYKRHSHYKYFNDVKATTSEYHLMLTYQL